MTEHNSALRRIEMLAFRCLGSHMTLPTLVSTQGAQSQANSETREAERA